LVNPNGGGNYVTSYNASNPAKNKSGIEIQNYPNSETDWEIARKSEEISRNIRERSVEIPRLSSQKQMGKQQPLYQEE
jgi:hypothetical protein